VTVLLSLRGCSKTFAGRTVLHAAGLDVEAAQVHALLGQNGSGKSTLIKILSGYHAPDDGATLRLHGNDVPLPLAPGVARRHGLAFVHQDLGLAEGMTVLENMRSGRFETGRGWRIRWRTERQRVAAALARFDVAATPDKKVSTLSQVDRATVAILRALEDLEDAEAQGVLVLDEPTAYLPRDSAERLLAAVREVAGSGVGVLFVTHKLGDVTAIADRVTVLRDGRVVASEAAAGLTEGHLVERVLGFAIDDLYPETQEPRGELVLDVRAVGGDGVEDVALQLHRGEILGLTGLVGMGWERVPYLLFGAGGQARGELTVGRRSYALERLKPRDAIAAGLALLPANRQRDGGAAEATVAENVTLPTLRAFFHRGRLEHVRERARVAALLDAYDVQPHDPRAPFAHLSGGNQQKVLLAKWFETRPVAFLMHEPTQGVDVGARQRIFQRIGDAAAEGHAFVLASAEHEDLAHLCDRVLVFRNGRIVGELAGERLTADQLLERCLRDAPAEEIDGAAPTAGPAEPTQTNDRREPR
jgi:ribose transport system ATP-binding protein